MRLNEISYTDAKPIEGYGPGFFRIGGEVTYGGVLNGARGRPLKHTKPNSDGPGGPAADVIEGQFKPVSPEDGPSGWTKD